MRPHALIYFLLGYIACARSQSDTITEHSLQWVGKKVPPYQSTTIDGKRIDSTYFKNRITILCFFSFNCSPCRHELSLLSELGKTLPKEKYQILLLGDATEKDLRDLRAYHARTSGKWKRRLGIDTLAFDIVSDCPDNPVRAIMRSCRGATVATFKVYGNPTTFFINQQGIIKKVSIGFAVPRSKRDDDYFYSLLKEAEQ
jgi:peroxiredoxin